MVIKHVNPTFPAHKTDFGAYTCLSPRANQILAQPPVSSPDLAPSETKPTRQPHFPRGRRRDPHHTTTRPSPRHVTARPSPHAGDDLLSGKDKHLIGGLANLLYPIPIGAGSHEIAEDYGTASRAPGRNNLVRVPHPRRVRSHPRLSNLYPTISYLLNNLVGESLAHRCFVFAHYALLGSRWSTSIWAPWIVLPFPSSW
jgi:hypothetical protein